MSKSYHYRIVNEQKLSKSRIHHTNVLSIHVDAGQICWHADFKVMAGVGTAEHC